MASQERSTGKPNLPRIPLSRRFFGLWFCHDIQAYTDSNLASPKITREITSLRAALLRTRLSYLPDIFANNQR